MNKTFPKLYKKTQTGAIQEWEISVKLCERPIGAMVPVIVTRYGQVDGTMQEARDVVTEGKNPGKKNATTPYEQAVKDAKSKWEKQLKKGYVENIDAAQNGDTHEIIEGGINPMLAQKYRDHAAKIKWPAYVQPKLDGIRCIAIVENGKCTLWSRTRKPINSVPHINAFLEKKYAGKSITLDGELYNHGYKDRFEEITSFVNQKGAPKPGHEVVQYHVYDVVISEADFGYRALQLMDVWGGPIVQVPTHIMKTEDDMLAYFAICLEEGYEGCMVRNAAGWYENKRSYGLQKVKEMEDAEFEVCGVIDGRGKMDGKAIFVCKVDPKLPTVFDRDGNADPEAPNQFKAKMKGKLSNLVQYFENPDLALGKLLTVQFQNMSAYGKPRFPVGKAIRDYE